MNWLGSPLQRMVAAMQLQEAVSSVAMSHRDDCDCRTCRAAYGDGEAFAELCEGMQERAQGEAER